MNQHGKNQMLTITQLYQKVSKLMLICAARQKAGRNLPEPEIARRLFEIEMICAELRALLF